jgi:hypothetical protein
MDHILQVRDTFPVVRVSSSVKKTAINYIGENNGEHHGSKNHQPFTGRGEF